MVSELNNRSLPQNSSETAHFLLFLRDFRCAPNRPWDLFIRSVTFLFFCFPKRGTMEVYLFFGYFVF